MKIRAKFIGTNSLGYENGKEYELGFTTNIRPAVIVIWRLKNDEGYCEYRSLRLFLQNWEVLE